MAVIIYQPSTQNWRRRIREKAEAEGLTVEAYVERLVIADQIAEEELESLALESLNSGAPIDRWKRTGTR